MKNWVLIFSILVVCTAKSHDSKKHLVSSGQENHATGEVTYLGNTGLMVSHGEQQVMFDPFFHNHYNNYQLVPAEIRTAIFTDKAPFDSIEMILISHAHGDHFDVKDVIKYLKAHPETQLLAPTQAVNQLKNNEGFDAILKQIKAIDLVYGDQPIEINFEKIKVEVVRIPHAGWPERADVSNLVYRVTLNDDVTVMHMGDADPNDDHFKPWANYWEKKVTNNAFPPYWFLISETGKQILSDRINAEHHTGVHVPISVPVQLKQSGEGYFYEPGKVLRLKQLSSEANSLKKHEPNANNGK